MPDKELVVAHYQEGRESSRLDATPVGRLERLRTWDLLARWLPSTGTVYDIGGGAGVHAQWLAERGYDVELFDLVPLHVEQAVDVAASLAASTGRTFEVEEADARRIPRPDGSADVVLLLGPLYHLTDGADRAAVLVEAARLLKPAGVMVAAAISRFSWLNAAYYDGVAGPQRVQEGITFTVETGRSNPDPTRGDFWAYFHRPEELVAEIESVTSFGDVGISAVEGFAWVLPDLADLLDDETAVGNLFAQLRTVEAEPSLLGISPHLLARAARR